MLTLGAATGDTDGAIERVLGIKTKELSEDWHAAIRKAYEPTFAVTTPPSQVGRRVVEGKGLAADLNVGPAISPDGRWVAFLSTRSVFSVDLFVADADSGKIVRKLTSTASDPHFSSIQFIYSAGAWDAASQQIAIATGRVGPAGAGDLRRRQRIEAPRSPDPRARRDLQSDLGSGRPRDLLHRHDARPHRSLHLRP
jgi:hypothetical protein